MRGRRRGRCAHSGAAGEAPTFERLEGRILLTTAEFSTATGLLTITGDAGDNNIVVTSTTVDAMGNVQVTDSGAGIDISIDGGPAGPVAAADVLRIIVDAQGGNDTIHLGGIDAVTYPSLIETSLTGGAGADQIIGTAHATAVDTFAETASGNIVLTDTSFTGNGADTLSDIEAASITGSAGTDTFTVTNFTGQGTLTGGGGTDTLVVAANTPDADITLSDMMLTVSTGGTFSLSGFSVARLTGGAGDNTIDAAGFSGTARLVETLPVAGAYTLSDSLATGLGMDMLSGIDEASITGSGGNDTINASGFSQPTTLSGGNGNDSLIGGSGSDSLIGGAGDDNLSGGEGDDTLTGGAGNDTMAGGSGTDLLVETMTGTGTFTVTNTNTTSTGSAGLGNDSLSGIDEARVTGSGAADTINASSFSGPVTLDGAAGNDCLVGGAANDSLDGGAGDDTLTGGAGNDTVTASLGTDVLDGGDGNDMLLAIMTQSGAYTFAELLGVGTVQGGGLGADTLININSASVVGTTANDNINASAFTGGPVTLFGNSGNDNLTGTSFDDVLTGGPGNDNISGGDGNDLLLETNNGDFTLTNTAMTGGLGTDTLSSIDRVHLIGGAGNNVFTISGWNIGPVTIDGADGTDRIQATNDGDFTLADDMLTRTIAPAAPATLISVETAALTGGGAANQFTVSDFTGTATINGAAGIDRVISTNDADFTLTDTLLTRSTGGSFTLTAMEEAHLTGGPGNNTINALGFAAGPVTLDGGDGHDVLRGGSGSDLLLGGMGDDTLTGGAGNDSIDGGEGNNRLIELLTVATTYTLTDTQATGLGTDTLAGIGSASLTGSAGNDIINGSAFTGRMTLSGAAGNDSLIGGANDDSLAGGLGDDTLLDSGGTDIFSGGGGTDTLIGLNVVNLWDVTGANTGTLSGQAFTSIERLQGGTDQDTFDIQFGGSVALAHGGGGSDTLNILDQDETDPHTYAIVAAVIRRDGADVAAYSGLESIVFHLGDADATGDDSTLDTDTTFIIPEFVTLDFTGVLDGAGGLNKQGLGTLLLNADSPGYTGDVTVNAGTVGGNGSVAGGVTVNAGGTLAPGTSPGILSMGDLLLVAGATFRVELVSPYQMAGADYDQLVVTGTVNLGGATLELLGGIDPPPSPFVLTIIDNDGDSDPVVGTFAGLAEGDTIDIGAIQVRISYTGGDGNDVTLSSVGNVIVPGTDDDDDFLVLRNGDFIQVFRNGVLFDERDLNTEFGVDFDAYTIEGRGGNDTVTIDYGVGGFFGVPIFFNGGADFDTLTVTGGSFTTVTHTFTTSGPPQSGFIDYDTGMETSTITYTGLEPVDMTGSDIDNLVFNLPAGMVDNDAVLEALLPGVSQIRSGNGTFETTLFTSPNVSLTVNMADTGAATDRLLLAALADDFDADVSINGGPGGMALVTVEATTGATNSFTIDAGTTELHVLLRANTRPVSINGGLGDDTLEVGSDSQSLDGIEGAVSFVGGGGMDVLQLRDEGDGDSNTYAVQPAQVTRGDGMAMAVIDYTAVSLLLVFVSADGAVGNGMLGTTTRFDTPMGGLLDVTGDIGTDTFDLFFGGDGDVTATGAISGGGTLTMDGSGTLRLDGINTYTGLTTVASGTLLVGGSVAGDVLVQSGATLGGDGGSIGGLVTVEAGAFLAPGESLGILTVQDLALSAGSTFIIEFNAPYVDAGTDFDQLIVLGTVDLGGATLELVSDLAEPMPGQQVTIIDNQGMDPVTGTFLGLNEGATIIVGAFIWTISYSEGDGNDVVLTAVGPLPVGNAFAVDTANRLYNFDTANPSNIILNVTITGLEPGEFIEAIDFRPATGQLYALGLLDGAGANDTEGRIYTLNLFTGAATLVGAGPFSSTLIDGAFYGFDFDPVTDRIRIVNSADQNLRVNPSNGTLVMADTDLDLAGDEEQIIAAAYDRTGGGPEPRTTLFGVNLFDQTLVRIGGVDGTPSPDGGVVTTVGALGVTPDNAHAALAIEADTETAYASLTVGGVTRLYTINLTTGAAILVGTLGDGMEPFRGLTLVSSYIVVAGTGGDDTLIVTPTGPDSGSYVLNGGAPVEFEGITAFTWNAGAGNDTFVIDNDGSLLAPLGGVFYHGQSDVDRLVIQGDPGISIARETYLVGATQDTGTWVVDPDGNMGPGAAGLSNGDELIILFTGLEPVDSDVPAAVFDVIFTDAADEIVVQDGGDLNGFDSLEVADISGTFETFRFANKQTVRLHLNEGVDQAYVDYSTPAAALETLEIYGHVAGDVMGQPADDDAADDLNFIANGATVTHRAFGGGGDDTFNLAAAAGGLVELGDLPGAIEVDGEIGDDALSIDDLFSATGRTYTLTGSTLHRTAGFGGLNYLGITMLTLRGGQSNDTIDIHGTLPETEVFGRTGDDVISVGNLANSLDDIVGMLTIHGEDGQDTLNIIDSDDPDPDIASITDIGGDMTELAGFAPVSILYSHDGAGGQMEFVNIFAAAGGNTITINDTTASMATMLDSGTGSDTITIHSARLSADNLFTGGGGNDELMLGIAAMEDMGQSALFPLTGLTIIGGPNLVPDDSAHRDRLIINDAFAAARELTFEYLAVAGGLEIRQSAPNTGFLNDVAIQIETLETLIFNSLDGDNDLVTVLGVDGEDSFLAVAPRSLSEALVFLNGAPWNGPQDGDFHTASPGVAGGGTGPDMRLTGLTGPLSVDGQATGASGNRLYIYAPSEDDVTNSITLDIFGFGPEVLIPGFGSGNAYDQITITDALVAIDNSAAGPLLEVQIAGATFVQTNSSGDPGLIVNSGFEVGFDIGTGLADDITVGPSPLFIININGGDPDPNADPDDSIPPDGDRLTINGGSTHVRIFNSEGSPDQAPTVSIEFVGSGHLGVGFSSIESISAIAATKIDIVGDNNGGNPGQRDYYRIVGTDVTGDFNGAHELMLQVKTIDGAGVASPFSLPLSFAGVEFLTFDGLGGADVLDITPYADNTPRGWGIHIDFDEGMGDAEEDVDDLLIYNTVAAHSVSENIIIQPSGPQAGQVQVTNAVDGSMIVTIDYINNLDIIVNDNDGFLGDSDTLTLRGTNGAGPGASGLDDFIIDLTAAGTADEPMVDVRDAIPDVSLYRLRSFTGFGALNIEGLGGSDYVQLTAGRDDGSIVINVDGGLPAGGGGIFDNDSVQVHGTAGEDDAFEFFPGASPGTGRVEVLRFGAAAPTIVNFTATEQVLIDGDLPDTEGSDGTDTLIVYGTDGQDLFAVTSNTAGGGTVSVNGGVLVSFFDLGMADSSVTLDGLGGDDSVQIAGTSEPDMFIYQATGPRAGRIDLSMGAAMSVFLLESIEAASIDGGDPATAPGDTLSVLTVNAVITPGSEPGSGLVEPFDANGQALLPLSYRHIEDAPIQGGTAVIHATDADDIITLDVNGIVSITNSLGFSNSVDVSAFNALTIKALGGDDRITIASQAGSGLLPGGITIVGGPGSGDVLLLTGAAGQVENVIIAPSGADQSITGLGGPITASGLERLRYTGSGGNDTLTVNLGAGDNTARVERGAGVDQVTSNALPVIEFTALSILTVDGGAGSDVITFVPRNLAGATAGNYRMIGGATDTLVIEGSSAADGFAVTKPGGAASAAVLDIAGGVTVTETSGALGALRINALAGDDALTVNLAGSALVQVPLTFDGGAGNNSVTVTGAPTVGATAATYTPAAGRLVHTGGVQTLTLDVLNITSMRDAVPGTLTVHGTAASNAIHYTQGSVPANGHIAVDALLPIEFSGKSGLTINGGAGSDTLTIDDADSGTPITVTPLTADSATVSGAQTTAATAAGIESLVIDGQGGNAIVSVTGTAGGDLYSYTPGASIASAVLQVNALLAVSLLNMGADSSLRLADGGGTDTLIVHGTAGDDAYLIDASSGDIRVNGRFPVRPGAVIERVEINAGAASVAGDRATITGTAANDTFALDLSAATVTVNAANPVFAYAGIERLTLRGGGAAAGDTFNVTNPGAGSTLAAVTVEANGLTGDALNVTGTAASDTFTFAPLSAASGSVLHAGMVTPIQYASLSGTLTVLGGAGGFDVLALAGTEGPDTVTTPTATSLQFIGTIHIGAGIDRVDIQTFGGNDSITAGLGAPMLIDAGAGNDNVNAAAATMGVTILGGAGNDTLTGGSTGDFIDGGAGNDQITGGPGADTLLGGDGADVILWNPGDGSDLVEGGEGADVLTFNGAATAESFTLSTVGGRLELLRSTGGITMDVAGVEQVDVNAAGGADTVTINELAGSGVSIINVNLGPGDSAADNIILNGRTTADDLSITVSVGVVNVAGLPYAVKVSASTTADTLRVNGLAGDDTIKTAAGVEAAIGLILDGGAGNDFLSADATLLGGDGNDTLQGGAGPDSLFGGAGDDVILFTPGSGTDIIDGGGGFDVLLVDGTDGADTITIGNTSITVNGQTQNVTLSNIGRIDVNGRGGNDSITVSAMAVPALIDAGAGDDTVNGSASSAPLTILGGAGNDSLIGGTASDHIDGGAGNDTAAGGPGTDLFFGGDGADLFTWNPGDGSDLVEGGEGADALIFNGSAAAESFTLSALGARLQLLRSPGGVAMDVAGVERVDVSAGGGADAITVNPLGGSGVSVLNIDLGAGDSDTVTVHGSSLADNLHISQASGGVSIAGLPHDLHIHSATPADTLAVEGGAGDDTITAAAGVTAMLAVSLSGGAGNDVLSGDGTLNGGAGDDVLIFSAATTSFTGGDGFDVIELRGGDGSDVIHFSDVGLVAATVEGVRISAGAGDDTITLDVHTLPVTVLAGAGDDLVDGSASTGPLVIHGEGGADTLTGSQGADTLNGGEGDDLLDGGPGVNTLDGGAGNDTLRITGTAGDDTIDVAAASPLTVTLNGAVSTASQIDSIVIDGLGGADTVTIRDLSAAGLSQVRILGGDAAAADVVNIHGRSTADDLAILAAGDDVQLAGLPYGVLLSGPHINDLLNVLGNAGNDRLALDPAAAAMMGIALHGGAGDDTLAGSGGAVTLSGGEGDDVFLFRAGAGAASLEGGAGFDVFRIDGTAGPDVITVTPAAATVNGASQAFTLAAVERFDVHGHGGNDQFTLSLTASVGALVDGGAGNDTVDGTASTAGLTIFGGTGNDSLTGGAGGDQISGESGRDTITGGPGADHLLGGEDADLFIWNSAEGDDTIDGGADGADAIHLIGSPADDDVTVAPAGSNPTHMQVAFNAAAVRVQGVEQWSFQLGQGADAIAILNLTGTHAQSLSVDLGADSDADSVEIHGRSTADTITVQAVVVGALDIAGLGYGIAIRSANVADDALRVLGHGGNDSLSAAEGAEYEIGLVLDGGAGNDTLSATGGAPVAGRGITLLGGAGHDRLIGGEGSDRLDGGAGDDTLTGGAGNDTILGGSGRDTLIEVAPEGAAAAHIVLTNSTLTGLGDNVLDSLDDVELTGTEGDDILDASQFTGRATLIGLGGNDVLIGGPGANELRGGEGDDIYVFGAGGLPIGHDVVISTDGGSDTLDFSGAAAAVQVNMDSTAIQSIQSGATLQVLGRVEHFIGTSASDLVFVDAINEPRTILGGGPAPGDGPGTGDTLRVNVRGEPVVLDGDATTPGLQAFIPGATGMLDAGVAGTYGRISFGGFERLFIDGSATAGGNLTAEDFAAPVAYQIAGKFTAMATGDLNGDGFADVVALNTKSATVQVLLNNGDGTFNIGQTVSLRAPGAQAKRPTSIIVADLDGDGDLDIATANTGSGNVTVLRNHGNGLFVHGGALAVGKKPSGLAAGDVDGDGDIDLVTGSLVKKNTRIAVLRNSGAGTFAAPQLQAAGGRQATDVHFADINGDGALDIVAANPASKQVSVLLGNGTGAFGLPTSYGVPAPTRSLLIGDFNNDGAADVICVARAKGTLTLLRGVGNPQGTLAVASSQSLTNGKGAVLVAAADMDGDGVLDLALTNGKATALSIALGVGDGTFAAPFTLPASGSGKGAALALLLADLNNDGAVDLLCTGGGPVTAILRKSA